MNDVAMLNCLASQWLGEDERCRATDLAWAAGFFEGEGYIGQVGGEASIRLQISNTDLERLEHFKDIVGVGTIRLTRPAKGVWKTMYEWSCYSDDAIHIYAELRPWLGGRRRAAGDARVQSRENRVAFATAERACLHCKTSFRPPWSKAAWKVAYCSKRCQQLAGNKRYRAKYGRSGTAAHPRLPK